MGIKDLPGPGLKFRATTGPGSFKRKLSNATRYGELKNLRDNQEAIVDVVRKFERAIRLKGGLSRLQRREAWLAIKKKDKTITKGDKYEVQEALKHLGRSSVADGGAAKTGDKTGYLIEAQKKRNILRSRHQAVSDLRGRQFYSTQYGGGKVQTASLGAMANEPSGRTRGTMADLNIKRGATGFAQGPGEKKSAGNLPPQAPGGVRPIGL